MLILGREFEDAKGTYRLALSPAETLVLFHGPHYWQADLGDVQGFSATPEGAIRELRETAGYHLSEFQRVSMHRAALEHVMAANLRALEELCSTK